MATFQDQRAFLQYHRQIIEEEGTARQHGDTLEKRGISVDDLLNPSRENHSKKIKYFKRVSFCLGRSTTAVRGNVVLRCNLIVMCLFLLFKINAGIKEKLLELGPKNAKLIKFSDEVFERPGVEWDTLLSKWIKENPPGGDDSISNARSMSALMSKVAVWSPEEVARDLILSIEEQHNLYFFDSKFPLFGFMRDVTSNEKKHSQKLYLWQGEADAIAFSEVLEKYVIVEFKVVDNLSDYWQSKTDLCGKHLHQCLVYAKPLQLHMNLPYLPPSLIVVIHKVTGKEGYFALFEDYPKECYEKLDEYEWFTEQPSKRPLKVANTDKLLHEKFRHVGDVVHVPDPQTKLSNIFGEDATVKDLLDSLGYDSLEILRQEQ